LGLSLSYQIVEKHGGLLTFESQPGQGTKFYIFLPESDEYELKRSEHEKEDYDPNMKKQDYNRILIMDDDENVSETLQLMLEAIGNFDISVTNDASSCLDRCKEFVKNNKPFDFIILDLTIKGGKGGADIIDKLRKISPGSVFIVSSGYSKTPIMDNYQDYGFELILKKPYTIAELIQLIDEAEEIRKRKSINTQ